MNDDSQVKVISRLTIDTSIAFKNLHELAKETGITTKEVKRLAKEIEDSWREMDKSKTAEGTRMKQEEAMWRNLAKQKEADRKAQEVRMRQEIRLFEQMEAAQSKAQAQTDKQLAKEVSQKERMAAVEAKQAEQVALRAAKEREAAATALPNLAAQLSALQARMKLGGVVSLDTKKRLATMQMETYELQKQVGISGKLTQEQAKQVQNLRAQANVINASISKMAADQMSSPGGSLANMFGRRMEWFLAGSVFFGIQNAIRGVVTDVADIEYRMVALSRVMEDPLYQAEKMREEIFMLGQEFGFTFQEVQDIMLRWAQAGYDAQESIEATRASLLALNTAELNNEQATQSLIGIMAQWGLEANQLVAIIDKINKVSDDYAVTSQDVVDGLLRSSGAARAANMSFDETVALLTAMRESSGRTGREVGNAMNSIIAYVQRAKSLDTLQGAGINVFADADGTKLRSTFDLLAEMSEKWTSLGGDIQQSFMEEAEAAGLFTEEIAEASGALEEWTDVEKRNILQAGAGVYRRNYLLALLNNFTQVYDVLQTQETALGYSQRENQRTMDTAIKQWASFKAELQQFGYTVAAESGPLEVLKAMVRALSASLDAFNKLPTGMKNTLSWLGMVGAGFGVANLASRQFFGATLVEGAKAAWASIKELIATTGGIGPALLKLAPYALLFAGIAFAITKVNNEANRLQTALQDLRDSNDATMRAAEAETKVHTQNAELIRTLTDEYRALEKQKQAGGGADAGARQQEITAQIEEALGRETAARLKAAGYSEEASETVRKAEVEKAKASRDTVTKQIEDYRKALEAQMEAASKSISLIESQMEGWETYLTFTERAKLMFIKPFYWIRQAGAAMMEDWFMFLYKFQEGVAKIDDFLGLDTWAQKTRDAAKENFVLAQQYRTEQFNLEKELAEKEANIAEGPLNRQRALLTELREEIAKTKLETEGIGDGSAGYKAPPGGNTSSIVEGIIAETEALGKLNAETERHVRLLQERTAYNTREGASMDELRQADTDRVELTELLTERQGQLHNQAEAARSAYAELATLQKTVNTSTEEGAKAYAEIGKAMESMLSIAGDASVEWWQIERQRADLLKQNNAISIETIRVLGELGEQYDNGVLSLEAYVAALAKLEEQTGLSMDATKRLNQEQAKALKELWSQNIAEAVQREKDRIQKDIDTIESVLQRFRDLTNADDRASSRKAVERAYNSFAGVSSPATMPSVGEVDALLRNVMDAFATMDLGDLSPDRMAEMVGQDLSILRGFSGTAQGYLENIGNAAAMRLGEVETQLLAIDSWLSGRLSDLQAQLDALDEEEQQDEREKATDEHNERLKKMQDDLLWYQLQGEDEYRFEIAAIRKQMADEEKTWAETQSDWERADKRETIRDAMEEAKEQARIQREALEEERKLLQEQQQSMTEALNALLTYIASEMAVRKQTLEDQKTELGETSNELDETLKGVEESVIGTLAFMAAQDPEFYKHAQSLVDKLISGLESRKGELQNAVNSINTLLQSIQGGTPVVSPLFTSLPASGAGGKYKAMAEGAYVPSGRGGVLGLIGEGKHDEWVLPQPKLVNAVQTAMRSVVAPLQGIPSNLGATIGQHVRNALEGMRIGGAVDLRMPDGTIQRVVVEMFKPLGQEVRG